MESTQSEQCSEITLKLEIQPESEQESADNTYIVYDIINFKIYLYKSR